MKSASYSHIKIAFQKREKRINTTNKNMHRCGQPGQPDTGDFQISNAQHRSSMVFE